MILVNKHKILFITGTRADFGKLRPLIEKIDDAQIFFDYSIFVTGMHTLSRYGSTMEEVFKTFDFKRGEKGYHNIYVSMNQTYGESMEMILANTISSLSRYVKEFKPDMIIVHGDRVEALAGAIVGAFENILVGHIEGGEISGTIDESIRHAITKLSHIHFTCNKNSYMRLKQLGENEQTIYTIGSPDIDLMLSDALPSFDEAIKYYNIPFLEYAILLFHPVTTNTNETRETIKNIVDATLKSKDKYIVIYPNNDFGCEFIFIEYERLNNNSNFVIYPSLRVTYFLTLLKNAQYIIGNSSAGIRETPVYGVPSINIGTRQSGRHQCESIVSVGGNFLEICKGIQKVHMMKSLKPQYPFGKGDSASKFLTILKQDALYKIPRQKKFYDLPGTL